MSQQKPPTVHLPPIEVNPYKESKYSPSVGRGVPGSRNQMWLRFQIHAEQQLDTAINWLIDTTENNKSVFASNYTHQLQALTSVIQSEINATVAAAGPIHDASPAASIYRELTAVRQLIHQKNLALPQLHAQANAFFSSDPLTKNRQDFINTLVNRDIDAMPHPDIYGLYPAWANAYSAAYTAKLTKESVRLLNERAASLTAQHATAVAQQAQREAEARRVADELARASAQAEANRIAQEQARVAAEKEAQRIAEEQARITTEAIRVANTYRAQGSIAAAQPLFITSIGTVAVSETARAGLQTAIRAVVTAAAGAVEGIASGVFLGASALLYSPSLGNGELPPRFAFSIPLSDLAPNQKQDLAAIAAAGGSIDLQVRIGSSSTADEQTELFVAPTNATTIPAKVRVVAATYDVQQRIYAFSTPDTPPRTVTWTPIVEPGSNSTALPAEQPAPSSYTGATVTALEGRIDTFPDIAESGFDDYVVIFPASDLPPLYVMFRDRRGDPGVATGIGPAVSGDWIASASQVGGAPIPLQIANQLRGMEFKSFRKFREAFWKAVANNPDLSTQFIEGTLDILRKGRAAPVRKSEQAGRRIKIELHHHKHLSQGGGVYDIDNIRLMTPKRHINTHKGIEQ